MLVEKYVFRNLHILMNLIYMILLFHTDTYQLFSLILLLQCVGYVIY